MRAGRFCRVRFGTVLATAACLAFGGCAGGSATGAPAAGPGVAVSETGGEQAERTAGPEPTPGADDSPMAVTGQVAWADPEADLRPSAAPEPTAAGRYQEVLDALEAIRSHTEGFRSRVDAIKDRIANPPEGSIQIG